MLIAFIHILYLLKTKRSSACWDTIEELLLLARTSDSATKGTSLENTSAGISTFSTMALPTCIRTRATDGSNDDQEDLQLLIGEDVSPTNWTQEVIEGEPYGVGTGSPHPSQGPPDMSGTNRQANTRASQLVKLLLGGSQPQNLINKAVRRSPISMQAKNWFRDLLTTFSEDLSADPTNSFHGAAMWLFQRRVSHVAAKDIEAHKDASIASSATSTSIKVDQLPHNRVKASNEDDGSRSDEKESTPLITKEFKQFVLSSPAFIKLQNELCNNPEILDSILDQMNDNGCTPEGKGSSEDVRAHDLV